jgi:hypothetical protein
MINSIHDQLLNTSPVYKSTGVLVCPVSFRNVSLIFCLSRAVFFTRMRLATFNIEFPGFQIQDHSTVFIFDASIIQGFQQFFVIYWAISS